MSELAIDLSWKRGSEQLRPGAYSSAHSIRYSDNCELAADAAPDYGGAAGCVNPEQSLAAAVSSCHMMTFLALAAKMQWPVSSYQDHAVAYLGKNPNGQMSVTRIDLHPVVHFDSGFSVEPKKLMELQKRAHRYCFIANSLAESVETNILGAAA